MCRRITLIKAFGIKSSYDKKNSTEKWDIEVFKDGSFISPDMFEALKILNIKIKSQKGNLYITDLFRSWETQKKARENYLSKKGSYVAEPGASFHNAGRAVDISVDELNFEKCKKEDWLKKFWDIALPIGFHPIIEKPDIKVSEAWHFDFPGTDWEKPYKKLSYSEVAKCAILDIGKWDDNVSSKETKKKMFIQSQLIRLGHYEIGKVDGIIGNKTRKVLSEYVSEGKDLDDIIEALKKK